MDVDNAGTTKYLFEDLTFKIIGSLFEVNKELGFGYNEKVYQQAFAKELERRGIAFKRENFSKISYKGNRVGCLFHDFLVEGKVVVELKVGSDLYESYFKQLLSYLRDSKLRIGILAVFTPQGLVYKRLIN